MDCLSCMDDSVPSTRGRCEGSCGDGKYQDVNGNCQSISFCSCCLKSKVYKSLIYIWNILNIKKNVNILGENSATICVCMNMERKLASM